MGKSQIEWTEVTWNPVTGCDRVSTGCDHCYALTLAKRLKAMGAAKYQTDGDPRTSGPGFGLTLHPQVLQEPYRWRGHQVVFVNSMSAASAGLSGGVSDVSPCRTAFVDVRHVSRTCSNWPSLIGERMPKSRGVGGRQWKLDVVAFFRSSFMGPDDEVEQKLSTSSTRDREQSGHEPRLALNSRARPGFLNRQKVVIHAGEFRNRRGVKL